MAKVEDHRQLKAYFDAKNKQYYSFQLQSELPLRVMLKRLLKSPYAGEIIEELLSQGYPVRSVK